MCYNEYTFLHNGSVHTDKEIKAGKCTLFAILLYRSVLALNSSQILVKGFWIQLKIDK